MVATRRGKSSASATASTNAKTIAAPRRAVADDDADVNMDDDDSNDDDDDESNDDDDEEGSDSDDAPEVMTAASSKEQALSVANSELAARARVEKKAAKLRKGREKKQALSLETLMAVEAEREAARARELAAAAAAAAEAVKTKRKRTRTRNKKKPLAVGESVQNSRFKLVYLPQSAAATGTTTTTTAAAAAAGTTAAAKSQTKAKAQRLAASSYVRHLATAPTLASAADFARNASQRHNRVPVASMSKVQRRSAANFVRAK
jgi:hypothetical protein